MKKNTAPHHMTLSQFLLFLVVGGIAVVWLLFFEISPRLRYGDPLYPVNDYDQLKSDLMSNTEILLPEESSLPSGDRVSFSAYESTRKKLDPLRDGYQIGVLGENYAYSIECSPADDPMHRETTPIDIRADYMYHGISVMRSDTDYPQLEFIVGDYYYNVNAWGADIPENALDILLNITDNMLQQAG